MKRGMFVVAAVGAALVAASAHAQTVNPVQAAAILEDVRVLSSDGFQGRGPGERGEAATLAHLKAQFEAVGLVPGGPNGSWFQDVPLMRMDHSRRQLRFSIRRNGFPLEEVRDWSVSGSHQGEVVLRDGPLVFVGFGVHAPDLGWDDYAGADVRGKVVVLLPNDPDFAAEAGPFGGRAKSRYSSGKPAAAFQRGAVGVIIVHREALTSWPWQQRVNSDPDPSYRRAATPAPAGGTRLQASAMATSRSACRRT